VLLHALNRLGTVSMFQKHYAEARQRFDEGRALAAQSGNRERLGVFLNNLGEIERLEARFDQARDLYREALAINHEIGRRDAETLLLSNLGIVSLQLGDTAEAERYAREALRQALALGFTPVAVGTLIVFAQLRARSGNHAGALALLGLVLNHPATDADLREFAAPTLAELRAKLAPEAVEAGLACGRSLDLASVSGELLAQA
jgi:tetratricopeptide (TPR) repeat protein